jgi:hypothetical protein
MIIGYFYIVCLSICQAGFIGDRRFPVGSFNNFRAPAIPKTHAPRRNPIRILPIDTVIKLKMRARFGRF